VEVVLIAFQRHAIVEHVLLELLETHAARIYHALLDFSAITTQLPLLEYAQPELLLEEIVLLMSLLHTIAF